MKCQDQRNSASSSYNAGQYIYHHTNILALNLSFLIAQHGQGSGIYLPIFPLQDCPQSLRTNMMRMMAKYDEEEEEKDDDKEDYGDDDDVTNWVKGICIPCYLIEAEGI